MEGIKLMETIFKLSIKLDNAAFDDPCPEIARILKETAARIEEQSRINEVHGKTRDYNGNTVGEYYIS